MGKIVQLYNDKEQTQDIYPRTQINAVSAQDGTNLQSLLSDMQNNLAAAENNYLAATESINQINNQFGVIQKIEIVSAMPETPLSGVLYLVMP